MRQEELLDISIDKDSFNKEQSINYRAFISCLADIMLKMDDNKDIDKDLIEE